jgi:DNA-binding GntR family transcriptional regulator
MTQVINAIGARGYSREEAEECYEALELLALQSFERAFEGLDELNRGEVTEKLKLEIANILLNALKNVSLADGDILSAIAVGINKI